jgi:hypothetical protein
MLQFVASLETRANNSQSCIDVALVSISTVLLVVISMVWLTMTYS